MKKQLSAEELALRPVTLQLKSHIVRDLDEMVKNTKQPLDELVSKALLMFIATHNDYLGRRS